MHRLFKHFNKSQLTCENQGCVYCDGLELLMHTTTQANWSNQPMFIFTLKEQNKCFINWLRTGAAIHTKQEAGGQSLVLLALHMLN
jgi:hypothetical protein